MDTEVSYKLDTNIEELNIVESEPPPLKEEREQTILKVFNDNDSTIKLAQSVMCWLQK